MPNLCSSSARQQTVRSIPNTDDPHISSALGEWTNFARDGITLLGSLFSSVVQLARIDKAFVEYVEGKARRGAKSESRITYYSSLLLASLDSDVGKHWRAMVKTKVTLTASMLLPAREEFTTPAIPCRDHNQPKGILSALLSLFCLPHQPTRWGLSSALGQVGVASWSGKVLWYFWMNNAIDTKNNVGNYI